MLMTTFARLHKARACIDQYRHLAKALGGITKYGQDTPISLTQIVELNGLDDALWALRTTIEPSDKLARLFACDCAERVLPLFESKYPNDKRPRQAIETARRFANGEATQEEMTAARAAAAAARAAADAIWAARDAAAAWAAAAAADAAWDAADAAWAAARAAADAADAADAIWAARDAAAAWAAAAAAERQWQEAHFIEMLDAANK